MRYLWGACLVMSVLPCAWSQPLSVDIPIGVNINPGATFAPSESADKATVEEKGPAENKAASWSLVPKQKFTGGTHHYWGSDTSINLDLPFGINLNADVNVYKTATSSATPTTTLGLGEYREGLGLFGSYAITGLSNDTRSTVWDVGASVSTPSQDFKTTLGADINITHYVIYVRTAHFTRENDITQKNPTFSLKQRFWKTRVTVDVSQSVYNANLTQLSFKLNQQDKFGQAASLGGLIAGFPDRSDKWAIYQDLGRLPLTLWFAYENVHMVDTAQTLHATTDSYSGGADLDIGKALTAAASYNYVRETGQETSNYYSFSLMARF